MTPDLADPDMTVELVRQTLLLALLVAGPMLAVGLVVGVAVSLVQAVTQLQEQTLAFVPKIAAMIAAAAVLMPWITERVMDYSRMIFTTGGVP